LSSVVGPSPLTPAEAHELTDRGVWLIDARSIREWAAAHPVGAISIELRAAFASWLGWVVPFGEPIVLLIDPNDVVDAVRQAHRIGYDQVCGWIDGGIDAWRRTGLPIESTEEVDAETAAERQAGGATLLDVRQASEHASSRIPAAVHLELGDIIAGQNLASDDVIAFCGHGERSATAASFLERRGIRVANFVGGLSAWEMARLPIER
jgi:rhodanese-related sulfurtransferase